MKKIGLGFFIIVIIIIICYIVLVERFYVFEFFQNGKSLQLNFKDDEEILYIEIFGDYKLTENKKSVTIKDQQKINTLIDYINNLEVIEKDDSFHNGKNKNLYISIIGNKGTELGITFTTRYLYLHPEHKDWDYVTYYIKDCDYSPFSDNTNISLFIQELLNN